MFCEKRKKIGFPAGLPGPCDFRCEVALDVLFCGSQ